jgi:hypothetical protein
MASSSVATALAAAENQEWASVENPDEVWPHASSISGAAGLSILHLAAAASSKDALEVVSG